MKINTRWISKITGEEILGYHEDNNVFSALPNDQIKSVATFCYFNGKFVIVNNAGLWQPVAGRIESGETPEQALVREVKEESNMQVLKYYPVGYHFCLRDGKPMYQTHYLCFTKPYGPFVSDPASEVTEIKLVSYDEINKYVLSEDIGLLMLPRCLEIIKQIDKNN
jgi:8-oxo-dGTP pyrophosphatase MutT (NUDIX family)